VVDIAIINASPLIFLSRGGHIDLLLQVARRIIIPRPVATEILARGVSDPTFQAIKHYSWLENVDSPDIPEGIKIWNLGSGESSVLALALKEKASEIVMDDLAGRRCAMTLNIPVRGTLGVVLMAKQKGIIAQAKPVIEELVRGGMYLSRHVLEEALKLVGE